MAEKIHKANKMIDSIQRSFTYLDKKLFKTLYISFVRPHLEYASPIWSPFLKKHLNQIESVQRRATKLVQGFKSLSYKERLQLLTLTFRRKKNDIIEIFKYFHCHDSQTIQQSFIRNHRPSIRHNYQLVRKTAKDGIQGPQNNSFVFRSTKI